jgi:hypothetical protein
MRYNMDMDNIVLCKNREANKPWEVVLMDHGFNRERDETESDIQQQNDSLNRLLETIALHFTK